MNSENSVKNKVKVTIADNVFTLISEESEEYTRSIADDVNNSINEIKSRGKNISVTAAVILTALNYREQIQKSEKDTEGLKHQLSLCLDEAVKNKETIAELKKENEKLRKDLETYRKRLGDSVHNGSPVSSAVRKARKSVSVSESEEAAEDDTNFFSHPQKGR